MSLESQIQSLAQTIGADMKTALNIQQGFSVFPIWAEENGNLSNNNRQWSFGNGSVGVDNIAMPDCEVFALSFHSEVLGTSVTMDLMINDTIGIQETFTGNTYNTLGTPVSFVEGDLLGFRTSAVTGTFTDARICAWCRVALQGLKGDQGVAGADGQDGAPGEMTWLGQWSAGTYLLNQAVQFGGSSYRCTVASTTQQPPNTDWDLIAEKGDAGASGGASYCKVQNTDTTTNINLVASGFSTIVPLNGSTILTSADFTPTGNGIQCNFTGVVNVKANVHYTSTGQRTTLMARARVAGTPTGMIGATGYIRNTSGHSEASMHIDDFFNVNNGDLIEIGVHRESTITTTSTLALAGSSNLILNRIE